MTATCYDQICLSHVVCWDRKMIMCLIWKEIVVVVVTCNINVCLLSIDECYKNMIGVCMCVCKSKLPINWNVCNHIFFSFFLWDFCFFLDWVTLRKWWDPSVRPCVEKEIILSQNKKKQCFWYLGYHIPWRAT